MNKCLTTTIGLIMSLLLSQIVRGQTPATQPAGPYTSLTNVHLTMNVYLPDAQKGYYRGTRFDASGMISRVESQGHTFFAPWYEKHDPIKHDSVVGTAGEFDLDLPQSFTQAKPGEGFVKIGVGLLEKPDESKYAFSKTYKILQSFPWETVIASDNIRFTQVVKNQGEYGYRYIKQIHLLADKPGFVIQYSLENTGKMTITTDHYCHNFVIIDDEKIGPAYRITYPFVPATLSNNLNVSRMADNHILFGSPLKTGSVWAPLTGYQTVADNQVLVENTHSGASLRIVNDFLPSKIVFYAGANAVCPESFNQINIEPGQTSKWSTQYLIEIAPAKPTSNPALPAKE